MFMQSKPFTAECRFGWANIVQPRVGAWKHMPHLQDTLRQCEPDALARADLEVYLDDYYNCARFIRLTLPGSLTPLHIDSPVVLKGFHKKQQLAAFHLTLNSFAASLVSSTIMPSLPKVSHISGYLVLRLIEGSTARARFYLNQKPWHFNTPMTAKDWQSLIK